MVGRRLRKKRPEGARRELMEAVLLLLLFPALFLCCVGCERHEVRPAPYARLGPPGKPRHLTPRVTIVRPQQGPISYQWTYTNAPDGARMLWFRPK